MRNLIISICFVLSLIPRGQFMVKRRLNNIISTYITFIQPCFNRRLTMMCPLGNFFVSFSTFSLIFLLIIIYLKYLVFNPSLTGVIGHGLKPPKNKK